MIRILVTDDDVSLLQLYESVLADHPGVAVDFATTTCECKQHLRLRAYDLVVMDLNISPRGEDGFTLIKDLLDLKKSLKNKAEEKCEREPPQVVMVSSQDDRVTVRRCQDLGARFISKRRRFLPNFTAVLDQAVTSAKQNALGPFPPWCRPERKREVQATGGGHVW